MSYPATGACQCNQLRYKISHAPILTVVCHCTDCQKTSAGAFSLTMFVKNEYFELLSGDLHYFDRKADSGNRARCYFCPTCSNRIYHENPEDNAVLRFKPGTLDDTAIIEPEMHVWTSSAQSWVTLPADIPCHETQPSMAELIGNN